MECLNLDIFSALYCFRALHAEGRLQYTIAFREPRLVVTLLWYMYMVKFGKVTLVARLKRYSGRTMGKASMH